MNRQLFDELSKKYPNRSAIHMLLRSGANINALEKPHDDHLTAFWHMRRGLDGHNFGWEIMHSFWGTIDIDAKVAAFKAHFYPLLDILELYNFDIMNGASFRMRPDGTRHLHRFAGFRLLDLSEFQILAKYDMPRFVQFFERMYFARGHHVDDTSVTGIPYLSPLLWSVPTSYKPAVILYFIMKGARWTQPGYEARITNFAEQVLAADAAAMIVKLQQQLGVNYVLGPQGANLRGFLAAAYGIVTAATILEKAVGLAGAIRRKAVLLHAPQMYA